MADNQATREGRRLVATGGVLYRYNDGVVVSIATDDDAGSGWVGRILPMILFDDEGVARPYTDVCFPPHERMHLDQHVSDAVAEWAENNDQEKSVELIADRVKFTDQSGVSVLPVSEYFDRMSQEALKRIRNSTHLQALAHEDSTDAVSIRQDTGALAEVFGKLCMKPATTANELDTESADKTKRGSTLQVTDIWVFQGLTNDTHSADRMGQYTKQFNYYGSRYDVVFAPFLHKRTSGHGDWALGIKASCAPQQGSAGGHRSSVLRRVSTISDACATHPNVVAELAKVNAGTEPEYDGNPLMDAWLAAVVRVPTAVEVLTSRATSG